MKNQLLLGVTLLVLASFNVQAQVPNSGNAKTTGANAASSRAGSHQSGGRSPKNSNAMTKATVDGSDGSATNDGASGQSGTPPPLPTLSSSQKATKSSRRTTKGRAGTVSRKAAPAGSKSERQ